MYHPVLSVSHIGSDDEPLLDDLDSLYNALMTLSTRQKQWISVMKYIGNDFTRATMRRILRTPEVMKEVLEFEGDMEVATKSVLQMESATRKLLMVANAKNRRRHQQRSKDEGLVLHRGSASVS